LRDPYLEISNVGTSLIVCCVVVENDDSAKEGRGDEGWGKGILFAPTIEITLPAGSPHAL
jgi:hypothetical protein